MLEGMSSRKKLFQTPEELLYYLVFLVAALFLAKIFTDLQEFDVSYQEEYEARMLCSRGVKEECEKYDRIQKEKIR